MLIFALLVIFSNNSSDKVFQANTFEEMAELGKKHGLEMFQISDEAHLKAMNKMQKFMKSPNAML